jgi:Concanavalin A-like lectin/glucanases superfamily
MKNLKVQPLSVCPPVASRFGWGSFFIWMVVFAACLLGGNAAQAQTPALKFTFEDAPGTTTASTGSTSVSLFIVNAANAATDLHGAVGSGVLGSANGNRSLDFSSAPNYGGANAPMASVTNSSALGYGVISAFTITEWFKENQFQPPVNGLLGRMFVLGAGTGQTDINAANTIGMKWQQPNQWNVDIGNATDPTATAIFSSNLPTNKWLFMGIVYDGTNVMVYQGSDTASANLISTTAAPIASHPVNLGGSATLYVGNRNTRQRGFAGWIDDFRVYTNYAGSANFVESIRQESAPLPSITSVYPNGQILLQATNTLSFNVSSPSAVNITNVSVVLNGVNVSSQLQYVTNGAAGSSTNLSVSYPGLQQNIANTVVISVADANGTPNTYSGVFDTFNPTNFIWEAEEFDHDSGQYIDNPDYTSSASSTSYFGLDSVNGVDTSKGAAAGAPNASDYRAGATDATRTQTPASTDVPRQRFLNLAVIDPTIVDHVVGNWSSAEWQNYTKTFPAGTYNVYARISTASSGIITLSQVTSGQGTSSQTTSKLGTFTVTGTSVSSYQWAELKDSLGLPATVNLSGLNTVRLTSGGGANANFYMLVPVNPNLPTISNAYPNGQVLFQTTNQFVFTVSSAVTTISTGNIVVTLNGTNVSSSLTFSGSPSSWNVSYTGLQSDQTYSTTIGVTDANGQVVNAAFKFDTWNPVFQVEAEDFDFGSGQYIDNPAPTTGPAANSYFGLVGTVGIDEFNNGAVPPFAGANPANYRNADPTATTPVTDAARQQFLTAGASDYNVGFLGPFFWQNYTKTWPAGTYNVYVRAASGAVNPATIHLGLDLVTNGWGTTAQFTQPLGLFTIPTSGGYSAYLYVPLIDQFSNYANVTLSGTNTLRATFAKALGTKYPGDFGLNINFYMLVAARTDLARIDNVYPNNLLPMQYTNNLSFVASSPNGINTTNIQVILNGVNISSNLVFSGSSTSWNVSYPGLVPGTYTAVITITDANNQTHTTSVNFTTAFNPNDFTWEAEDFDFDPANSPAPNGSGLRYIDNPVPTSSAATNSYFGQIGDLGIDYSSIFSLTAPGTYIYRPSDYISTEVTSDATRQKYIDAQVQNMDPTIADYDINFWATNGWINYTRTFPTGNFYLYGRLSAATAFNLQCSVVTNGWGTATQQTQYLGTFTGVNTNFANWQYVPMVNTNTGLPVIVSLGGTNTFQMTGDYKENANFFELVPAVQSVNLTAALVGGNIKLSFPTQNGGTYTIFYKINLTDPTWTQLGAQVTGNGSTMSVMDTTVGSSRFYRLTIQ